MMTHTAKCQIAISTGMLFSLLLVEDRYFFENPFPVFRVFCGGLDVSGPLEVADHVVVNPEKFCADFRVLNQVFIGEFHSYSSIGSIRLRS